MYIPNISPPRHITNSGGVKTSLSHKVTFFIVLPREQLWTQKWAQAPPGPKKKKLYYVFFFFFKEFYLESFSSKTLAPISQPKPFWYWLKLVYRFEIFATYIYFYTCIHVCIYLCKLKFINLYVYVYQHKL